MAFMLVSRIDLSYSVHIAPRSWMERHFMIFLFAVEMVKEYPELVLFWYVIQDYLTNSVTLQSL